MIVSLLQMMGFPLGRPVSSGEHGGQAPSRKAINRRGVPDNQGITRTDEGHPRETTLAGSTHPRAGAARRQDVKPQPKAAAKTAKTAPKAKAKTPDANPERAVQKKEEADRKVAVQPAADAPGKETVAQRK